MLSGCGSFQRIRARDFAQVTFVDRLDNSRDKGVFLKLEVSLLNVIKKFLATSLSNEESHSRSTTLESDFSSILKIANKKVLFYQTLMAFVPISVP